ncbi:MAG TPA: DUF1223 domain-containing protein [Niastella sp.]
MKSVKTSAICAVMGLTLFSAAFVNRSAGSTEHDVTTNAKGFAVLELFTSEGCSSCPPADELIARMQKEAGDKPIYILAYHVDYWNRLGWKDKFSDPLYSKRQYNYSQQFSGQVYTPQVIINGQSEFVGSNELAVNSKVKEALNGNTATTLSIQGQQQSGKIKFDYQITGNAGKNQLLIAVVQKHAVSKVEKGENKGRTLSHAQIVRSLHSFDVRSGGQGAGQISLPGDFNTEDWECIGMIQDPETGKIEAATRISVNPVTPA